MTALSTDKNTPRRSGEQFVDPLAASTTIYAGALYALDNSGNAVPAESDGNRARGVAQKRASTAAGDTHVEGERGVYRFENSTAGAAIGRAQIGDLCYVADDQTVSKTGTAPAGIVVDVDENGVWVDVGAQSITVEITVEEGGGG